jgi:hypothetical protein
MRRNGWLYIVGIVWIIDVMEGVILCVRRNIHPSRIVHDVGVAEEEQVEVC